MIQDFDDPNYLLDFGEVRDLDFLQLFCGKRSTNYV